MKIGILRPQIRASFGKIAARWPNAQFAAMEVRPIMDAGGDDV